MTKCIITGASGFIGSHLTEFLLKQGFSVYSLDKDSYKSRDALQGEFHFIPCNILDRELVINTVAKIQPNYVFHLAAQSLPQKSWEDPETTFRINVFGTLNLLDAIRQANIDPIIEVFCSSGEYAISNDGKPIMENYLLEPSSPYALSKISQDQLCALYGKAYNMKIIRVRPFFIIGPRKTGDASSDFARGVVAVERGLLNKIKVGNLNAVRDFLDVKDAVNAFYAIVNQGISGEVYNVCSGVGRKVSEIIEGLKVLATSPIYIEVDPLLFRPIDEPIKIGNNGKLSALGWKPLISFQESLQQILEFWRSETK